MGTEVERALRRQIKSYKPRKTPAKEYLGFANAYEEQLFRALAAVHPKAIRIADAGWRLAADGHVKLGYALCASYGPSADYRLTREGVRRPVAERLLRE